MSTAAGNDPAERNPNLDLLRATAIVMVVVFHLASMLPTPPWVVTAVRSGRFGVELFFVLSGWLIGGLFWKEAKRWGRVGIPRFMARRLFRTVPPYFVALFVAWLGSGVVRGGRTPVGWSYFVFLQNYVGLNLLHPSWSLCVEEHFYLVAPTVMAAVCVARSVATRLLLFISLATCTLVCRNVWPHYASSHEFETHLRLDGLVYGVALAHVAAYHPAMFTRMARIARPLAVPCALFVLVREAILPPELDIRFGFTLTELAFACILTAVVGLPALVKTLGVAVNRVALWSYSMYLTHTFAIHLALSARARLPWMPTALQYVAASSAVLVIGWVFYVGVERPALRLRDVAAPRRARPLP